MLAYISQPEMGFVSSSKWPQIVRDYVEGMVLRCKRDMFFDRAL